jgi:uncharacterized protein YoxC
VSAGQIAALVAAGALVLLVLFLAVTLVKMGRTLDAATKALEQTIANTQPIFTSANTTIDHVNTQLERVDGITSNVKTASGNISALTSLFTATLGGPLVKAAALSYGISKAVRARKKKKGGRAK